MIHNSGLIGKINLIKIFILFYFIKKYIFKYNNCITIVYDAKVSYRSINHPVSASINHLQSNRPS